MKIRPEVGDPVTWDGKEGVITSLVDEDGELGALEEDAVALTIQWTDGTFTAVLVSDLTYVEGNTLQ